MAEPKDDSFLRKVVRFVANPTTDWAALSSSQPEDDALQLEKTELKAMIERKKRNDFVRKREFDMLRKVRREGLTPEQLAALGGSSRLDDSEGRQSESAVGARGDAGVKAKIDEIEQQMVGAMGGGARRTRPGHLATRPGSLSDATTAPAVLAMPPRLTEAAPQQLPALPPLPDDQRAATAQVAAGAGLSPLTPRAHGPDPLASAHAGAVEVSEVVHDPDLDEAVIAFANADFSQCEQALARLTAVDGARAQHAETWLVLFDFYRATGAQARFESLALDYAQQFGWSAPQWFSLPRLVAEAAAAAEDQPGRPRPTGDVGWVCPEQLDIDGVARLNSMAMQMPLPWVFDWAALKQIDAQAAGELSVLMRHWATQPLDMRWVAGERLLSVLADATPSGVRDTDPAYWGARLDALKLAHRADQFEEAAIDYCVTYEVSPPSWERPRANVRVSNSMMSTTTPALTQASEVVTNFVESSLVDEAVGVVKMATVELSGQLVGDISATLEPLDRQLDAAALVTVSCTRLIRVDFVAAGDLLNWVLAKRGENRAVHFTEAHRLVALFFGAMGINEHAQVRVRNI